MQSLLFYRHLIKRTPILQLNAYILFFASIFILNESIAQKCIWCLFLADYGDITVVHNVAVVVRLNFSRSKIIIWKAQGMPQ